MTAALNLRHAVRAVIIDDDDHALLVKFVFPSGITAWALPGGGLDPGETHEAGLRRELHEELGIEGFEIGPYVWTRTHVIPMSTGHDGQTEHVHLVRLPRFEPHPTIGWDRLRDEFVHDMRWWSLDEVAAATETRFAPRRLAHFLGALLHDGPPAEPWDTGV